MKPVILSELIDFGERHFKERVRQTRSIAAAGYPPVMGSSLYDYG